jgi:hypothetical protein
MQTLKVVSLIFAASMFAAACGDSKSSLNPTAPSAISADALSAEAGGGGEYSATAKPGNGNGGGNGNGNGGNGNGNGNGNQPRTPADTGPAPTAPVPPGKAKVEIEGLITAVGGGSITVRGQVVTVTPDTVIRHGNRRFEISDLNEGDRVHVRASRVAATTGAAGALPLASTLEATEILLQNPGDGDSGEETSALVSVAAFDASASETDANTGTFRLTRTGDLTQLALPLTVSFTLTGTAVNGTDYESVAPLTATFLAGQPTVDVLVTPTPDLLAEGPETVILMLTSVPAPYELGSPVAATVDLIDAANPLVSVAAVDPSATEAGDPGVFRFTRTGDTTLALAVTVVYSGSATNGFDYAPLGTTVTIPAGFASVDVTVAPLPDAATDPSDTVIVTVVDAAAYDLDAVATATVTISGS